MEFCQGSCHRVFQPPFQLRGEGIYSHGCKQGCFQPPLPRGSGLVRRSGLTDHSDGPNNSVNESRCSWPTCAHVRTVSLPVRCNIGEMARKVSVKCAIAGCHYQRKMALAEREELKRVGRENNATAGLVCPTHVKAAFNFEFDDIEIDVPLEELLVEASKETPVGALS